MKQIFVKHNQSDRLNLIFLGYGQDGRVFETLKNCDCDDIALVYDYESNDFDASLYTSYSSINLITWSMGVMIAPKVLAKYDLLSKVESSSAINGTLEGIDDDFGIPLKMWNATIDAICESAVLKFYRRMCFDANLFDEYLKLRPQRNVDSLKAELIFIRDFAGQPMVSGFCYQKAYVGRKDKIISPVNQINSHSKTSAVCIEEDCAHYSLALFEKALV